jgi:hypothetical protein
MEANTKMTKTKKIQIPQPGEDRGKKEINSRHKDSITPNYSKNRVFLQYSDESLEIVAHLLGCWEVDQ